MIRLQDLQTATGAQLFGQPYTDEFSDFCVVAEEARPGVLFVMLDSTRQAGIAKQIEQAVSLGASGILTAAPPETDIGETTIIVVGDVVSALYRWASYVLKRYQIATVAAFGSAGTTRTLAAISSVLSLSHNVYARPSSNDPRFGYPLSLGGLTPEHDIAVIQLSDTESALDQALPLLRPDVVVLTMLGTDAHHSEAMLLRNRDYVCRLLGAMDENGTVVMNSDDPWLQSLPCANSANLLTFGIQPLDAVQPDLLAENVHLLVDKVGFDLINNERMFKGQWIPLLGTVGLYAALGALLVGQLFDIQIDDGLWALKSLDPVPGHLNVFDAVNSGLIADLTANASPASVLAALDWLEQADIGTHRRAVVISDLAVETSKKETSLQQIAARLYSFVDLLVTVGASSVPIARAARQLGLSGEQIHVTFRDRDAADLIRHEMQAGDITLICGSAEANSQRIAQALLAHEEDSQWIPRPTVSADSGFRSLGPEHRTWIDLDLAAFVGNLQQARSQVGDQVALMAVVSGNALGHGLLPVAATAAANGVDGLVVASVSEGVRLREAGITADILVMGMSTAVEIDLALEHDLQVAVADEHAVEVAAQAANKRRSTAHLHLAVAAGGGAAGFSPNALPEIVRRIIRTQSLSVTGLFTDLTAADLLIEAGYTQDQLSTFNMVFESLRATGMNIPWVHAAGSAAMLTLPASHYTAVRAGRLIYGLNPSLDVPAPSGFKPVLSWKTHVWQVRELSGTQSTRYGNELRDISAARIAVIPVGYLDGVRVGRNTEHQVLIHGQRAPIIGSTARNFSIVAIDHLTGVTPGDEVVLIGWQGAEVITLDDVARQLGVSNLEFLSMIPESLPRVAR